MPALPENREISAALHRIADLLELEGVDAPPVAAYRRAARVVAACSTPAAWLVERDGVEALHALGIGYLISGLVTDWIRSGELPMLQRLERKHDPEASLQQVPGIGPKLAREVHDLGIGSVAELARAVRSGRLEGVCGFGPKRIALIRAALRPRTAHPQQLDLIAAG